MLCLLSLISKYVSLVAYLTLLVALLLATFLSSGPKSNAAEMSSVVRRIRLLVFRNENTRLPSKRNIGGFVMSAKYARLKLSVIFCFPIWFSGRIGLA